MRYFTELQNRRGNVVLIRVALRKHSAKNILGSSGCAQRQRLEQLDRAMDAIRDKYGKGAIGRASTPKGMDRERHAPPPGGTYHPK